jgi:hypothetical protein
MLNGRSAPGGVLRSKGFGSADTMLQAQVRGNVILIGEADKVGTRAARRVFDLIEKQWARGTINAGCIIHPDSLPSPLPPASPLATTQLFCV